MKHQETIPALAPIRYVDVDSITVSGFSAGAFMASQLLVIHSDIIKGAGVVCGGPYGFFFEHAQKDGPKPLVKDIIPRCFEHEREGKIDKL